MKVLMITPWYPNSCNPLQGVFVRNHARAIKSAGVEIVVLALTINPSTKWFQKKTYQHIDDEGVKVHMIELNSRFHDYLYANIYYQYWLLKKYFYRHIAKDFSPDVIHSAVIYPGAVLGHWLARRERKVHVITEHWSKIDRFMRKIFFSRLGRAAYHDASRISVVSEYLKVNVMQYAAEDKIKVIPNVVETEVFNYTARESGKSEKIAFTCVAIWKKPKRPDLLFSALQQVSPQLSKPVVLNVVGEGPMMDELLARNWSFIINPVGNVDQKKLAEILKTTDYFLHASDHETFSLVIAEALSSGVPVLASGIGAIPELINENNGLTCENTVEAWSEAIQDLVARQDYDPYKIRELALRFDKISIGKAFMDLYQDVLESK